MIPAPWFRNLASKYDYEEGQWYAWVYLDTIASDTIVSVKIQLPP